MGEEPAGESSDSDVRVGKQRRKEKKLSPLTMVALIGGVGFCLVCCAGLVVVGLRSSGASKLTEDYYPHKPGAVAYYEVLMLETENSGAAIEYRYEFKSGGVIEKRIQRMGSYQNGTTKWTEGNASRDVIRAMNQKSSDLRHRKSLEFVEQSDDDGQWSPLIKLNAKPGEQWEARVLAGAVERYTLTKFDNCSVNGSNRPCAVIREELLIDGKPNTDAEATFAKGVGLYAKQVYDVSGGNKRLVSRWRLVEVPKDRRTGSEEAFYK